MKILITGMLLFGVISLFSQTSPIIFTVNTTQVTGIDNGLNGSITEMMEHAILKANAGFNSIIEFDVPDQGNGSGLIDISEPLPNIDCPSGTCLNGGSITLQNANNTSIEQGFRFVDLGIPYGSVSFILMTNNIASGFQFTIDNLTFKNFEALDGYIYLFNGTFDANVNISNNKFQNNYFNFRGACNGQFDFSNNDINEGHTEFYFLFDADLDCHFENNTVANSSLQFGGIGSNTNVNQKSFHISDNEFQNSFFNVVWSSSTLDNVLTVNIENNFLTSTTAMLTHPRPNWVFNGNKMVGQMLLINTVFDVNECGFNLYQPNEFIGTNIRTGGMFSKDCKISNQILNSSYIMIGKSYYSPSGTITPQQYSTSIFKTLIYDGVLGRPIRIVGDCNLGISPPILNSSTYFSYQNQEVISLNYEIDVTGTHGDYLVQFYESNPSADLIQFIGDEIKPTNGTYSTSFSYTPSFATSSPRIGVTVTSLGTGGNLKIGTSEVSYIEPIVEVIPCEDECLGFAPEPGKTYWLSAWVSESHLDQQLNYSSAKIIISYIGINGTVISSETLSPNGAIIENWQRIAQKIIIPNGAFDLKIELINSINQTNSDGSLVQCYFDDIRIHPFNGGMKSYVYDPVTYRLTSELDDNNFATFYEYDPEGGLIRIKKETSKGVMTIQETRSNTIKN